MQVRGSAGDVEADGGAAVRRRVDADQIAELVAHPDAAAADLTLGGQLPSDERLVDVTRRRGPRRRAMPSSRPRPEDARAATVADAVRRQLVGGEHDVVDAVRAPTRASAAAAPRSGAGAGGRRVEGEPDDAVRRLRQRRRRTATVPSSSR